MPFSTGITVSSKELFKLVDEYHRKSWPNLPNDYYTYEYSYTNKVVANNDCFNRLRQRSDREEDTAREKQQLD